ncbi:hypothetical protein X759_36065 [Mesorhizobium sp. LSHC420B00]|nr:hypothetical protein X759_36065 [Mesorhizobium sp. LSHC420B00]
MTARAMDRRMVAEKVARPNRFELLPRGLEERKVRRSRFWVLS